MIRLRDLHLKWLDDERHRRAVLIALLVIAFVLRLTAALSIPLDYRLRDDAVEYVTDARNLLALGVFGEEPGIPYATIPPAYPLFIAGIFALTNQSLLAVRLVQVALGTLMVWLTYLTGREIASRRIGLLGAFISAVYPVWVLWPALFLTETLYVVLLLAFTWCLIRSMKTGTTKYVVITGVTFGLALLTREVLLVFPVLLPVALWWSHIPWQRAWRYLLLFAVATLLTLVPWLARNYHTFGQVFYTERTAAIRYQLTGSGYLASRYAYLADESASPPSKKPPEYYERYGRASDMINIKQVLTDPVTYLRHLGNRLVEFWLHPNGLESLPGNPIIRAGYIAAHIGMLGAAIVGMVAGLQRRDVATGVLALLLAYITGTCLFFTGPNPRYTLPFLPIVFIFTASGAPKLAEGFTSRKPAPA